MNQAGSTETLTGQRKAAILVVLLGEQAAAQMFKHLSKRDAARIAREVAELGPIEPETAEAILEEYYLNALNAPRDQGGPEMARKILSLAQIDEEIVEKLIHDSGASGEVLGPLLEAPPEILALALQDEHPQTTALVLLHLPASRAAQLLAALPDEVRSETVLRMATLRQVRGEVLGEVATSLHQRLISSKQSQDTEDGISRTATVLGKMARAETKRLLEQLEPNHPDQVQELRGKLYTFDSLLAADDRGMQELLRQLDSSKIGLAICGEDEALQQRFLSNLSERAAKMLREEMEFVGTPNPNDKTAAQKEILDMALNLEAQGNLTFADGGAGDDE